MADTVRLSGALGSEWGEGRRSGSWMHELHLCLLLNNSTALDSFYMNGIP